MSQFAYTIFYVKDVAATIEFYEKAFSLERKFITPTNDYGELQTGGTTLSFASLEMVKSNFIEDSVEISDPAKKAFGMEIGFVVNDVPTAMKQAIKAGATLVAEAKEKPWGQVVGYVRDIDGFLVELCTSMG